MASSIAVVSTGMAMSRLIGRWSRRSTNMYGLAVSWAVQLMQADRWATDFVPFFTLTCMIGGNTFMSHGTIGRPVLKGTSDVGSSPFSGVFT